MTDTELAELVRHLRELGHDDAFTEAKACEEKLTNGVWPTVSAFANTSGGLILLGLHEKKGFIVPKGFSADRTIDQFVSGIGDGGADNAKMSFTPSYTIERHAFEGSEVVAVHIHEANLQQKPCYVSSRGKVGGSYKRVDDKDIKMSPTEIYELENALILSEADRSVVPDADLDDLDENVAEQIVLQARLNGSKAVMGTKNRTEALVRLGALDKTGRVRMGGLLVAGVYPQQFYPKLLIDVAVFPDNKKSVPGRPRFLDRQQCEGPVGEVISEALQAISKNLRTYSIVTGSGRKDELEIPRVVLREALSNAVVHREYGQYFIGQAISVDIFPNRVEITNPGGLWGGKTPENLDDGTSRCRNETLMKLMELVDLPDKEGKPAEGNGSGIGLMIQEMASRALPKPVFDAKIDSFTVILGRGGTEIPEFIAWVLQTVGERLPQHEETVLLTLHGNGEMGVEELRDRLGFDSDDIRAYLRNLESRGVAEKIGEKYAVRQQTPQDDTPVDYALMKPRDAVLLYLERTTEASAREISQALNRNIANIRYYIKGLIEEGAIEPTAPASSKSRRYRLTRVEGTGRT